MKHALLAAFAAIGLAGCSTVNHSTGSLQLNFDAETLPEDHIAIAAQMVSGRETVAPLTITDPAMMVGETPFSPQRWYVCIRGVKPKGSPQRRVSVQRRLEDLLAPPTSTNNYDVIVIFQERPKATVIDGYDTRLCRFSEFSPLEA